MLSGRIPACKWVKLACQRQLDDLDRWKKDGPYRWDAAKANRVCQFIELLPQIKGPKAGSNIVLEPWQCFRIATVFGWVKRDTGTRRFRKAYTEVPRGNGKSTESAGIALYMAFADDEGGAEAYSAATTRDQAKEVWEPAWHMVRKCDGLRRRFGVEAMAHSIVQVSTASRFQPLSADDDTLDGKNIHIAVIDELHAHKTRGIHDVLETGLGKRPQSLLWEITTSGFNRIGICYEVRTYVTKILEGLVNDDTQFGIIYTIDEDDAWDTSEALIKANPNWGVSVDIDMVRSTQRKAMQIASAVNNFLTKHLNIWVSADTAWMNMKSWDACADHSIKIEDFVGQPCTLFLDLASKTDIAAKNYLFRRGDHSCTFGRYYLPEGLVEAGLNTNCAHYAGWQRQGRMTLTPGEVIDFDYIMQDILDDCRRFQVEMILADPFQATYLLTKLQAEGLPVMEYGMTVKNFSEPMKQLEALVLSKRLKHDGCPVLAWMVSNVVAHTDAKDNIFPRKERPENKIDGAVALIGNIGWDLRQHQAASVYETRGLLYI